MIEQVLSNKKTIKSLSQNISYLRKKSNLTQKDLAGVLGYEGSSIISEWEKGVKTPSLLNIVNISRFFGVSVDALLMEKLSDNRRKAIRILARDSITLTIKGKEVECCPHCEKPLEGGRFCKHCGQEVKNA